MTDHEHPDDQIELQALREDSTTIYLAGYRDGKKAAEAAAYRKAADAVREHEECIDCCAFCGALEGSAKGCAPGREHLFSRETTHRPYAGAADAILALADQSALDEALAAEREKCVQAFTQLAAMNEGTWAKPGMSISAAAIWEIARDLRNGGEGKWPIQDRKGDQA